MKTTRRTVGLMSLAVLTAGSLSLAAQQPQNQQTQNQNWTRANSRLSGTYELESTRGGDPRQAAEMATRSLPPGQRDRAYQNLLNRLEPPQRLAIERQGRAISIASSRGPRAEFDADGRNQSERGPNGQMINTRAELIGDQLRVSTSSGNRGSDFLVTFASLNNGSTLRVTRRLDDSDLARPVTIQSFYRRVATTARWDVYGSETEPWGGRGFPGNRPGDRAGNRSGNTSYMTVPDGTRIVATLDTPISMRSSRHGDPFSMTVRTPGEFQGSRIEGVVTRVNAYRDEENGQDMRLDFRTILLRGRSTEFDAILNTVRLSDGSLLQVDSEGDVRDDNRGGNNTVRNGAIGAGVGAVIGALAGGGKGAVIGAAVGGVGGVILSKGRDQLDFQRGAEVTLTAVSRNRTR